MNRALQLDQPSTRLLARALTRPAFTALAKGVPPQDVFAFVPDDLKYYRRRPIRTSTLLQNIFSILTESYRSEYVYKNLITSKIVFGRHSPATASMQIELPVGKSFVDVAIFNGSSTAYEIKTEYDGPRRLETQTRDYLAAFDNVYLVTSISLAERYLEVCDPLVGILAITERDTLKVVRNSSGRHADLDKRTLFRMLRQNEYVTALEGVIGKRIDMPNGLISSYCEGLFAALEKGTAQQIFRQAMRQRTTVPAFVNFVRGLPQCLRALAYATPLSAPQRQQLTLSLSAPVAPP